MCPEPPHRAAAGLACLERQRVELDAVLGVLVAADAAIVEHAPAVSRSLPSPDGCANAARLREVSPLPDDPALAVRVVELRGRVARVKALNEAKKHAEVRTEAAAILDEASALPHPALQAEAHLHLGWAQETAGELDAAEESFESAVFEGRGAHADDVARDAAIRLVALMGKRGRADEGLAWARHAKSELVRDPGWERSAPYAALLWQVGTVHLERGDLDAAWSHYEDALAVAQRRETDPATLTASLHNALGVTAHRKGDRPLAREHFEAALRLREQLLGASHPHVAETLSNLANLLDELEEDDRARALQSRALSIREQVLPAGHPDIARSLDGLAGLAVDAGDEEEAARLYERSLALKTAALGPESVGVGITVYNLALLHLGAGRRTEAEASMQRALTAFTAARGPEHPQTRQIAAALEELRATR